ncbi:MAG TPA: hemolysin family protein [Candidatus Kapabacteria bacterium]
MDLFLDILLVVIIVGLNGFFVAAEFALVKVRGSQVEALLRQEDKSAKLLKEMTDHLDSYLSATQVGITLASLALGWVGEPVTESLISPVISLFTTNESVIHSISIVFGFAFLTAVHIVIGEQVPKSIAITYEKSTALKLARPLQWFYIIFRPVIKILNSSVNAILRLMGLPIVATGEEHSEEELRSVIMESAKRGVVTKNESELIESVFEFSDTTASSIMVHRSDVIGLDIESEPREILHIIESEGFSRLPVYRSSMDEITGVLFVKDLLPYIGQLERLSAPSANGKDEFFKLLQNAIRPPRYVSETMHISELLLEFQRTRTHIAFVVSEHGGVEGIVTLEDILEEIVGEIQDESDVPADERDAIEVGDALYIDPSMSVSDFNERYEERFSRIEESQEYQTISGYVQKMSGRIPNIGDVIEAGGIRFIVKRKVRHRLEQLKVERIDTKQIIRETTA